MQRQMALLYIGLPMGQNITGLLLSIIRKNNIRQIVKSKSMLTEECELNEFLHAAGN